MAEIEITNGGFETGDFTSWAANPPIPGNPAFYIQGTGEGGPFEGNHFAANRTEGNIELWNEEYLPCTPNSLLTVSCYLKPTRGSDRGTVRIWWYDDNNQPVNPPFTENAHNTPGHVAGTGGWRKSFLNNTPVPANATKFRVGCYVRSYTRSIFGIDAFEARDNIQGTIEIVTPEDGAVFTEGDTVQLSAAVKVFQTGNAPPSGGGGGSWAPPRDGGGGDSTYEQVR